MQPTRRHVLAGLPAPAVAPLLAACGQDETTSGTDEPAAPEASGAFPVTIEHKYGSTTLEKAPDPRVCVGPDRAGRAARAGHRPGGRHQVVRRRAGLHLLRGRSTHLGDAELPEVLEDTNGVQIEKVAALATRPDHRAVLRPHQEGLRAAVEIAPTVAQSAPTPTTAPRGTRWR